MKNKDSLLLDVARAAQKMMRVFDTARTEMPDSIEATGNNAITDTLLDRCVAAEMELRTALSSAIEARAIETDPEHYFGTGRGPVL